eukprot:Clim_evm9s159 gene=Clim_evmTU9s159
MENGEAGSSKPMRRPGAVRQNSTKGLRPGGPFRMPSEPPGSGEAISTSHLQDLADEAWAALEDSIIYYHGKPVGTVAARDPQVEALNYDQCFIRDFVSAALVFLSRDRPEIVRHFLSKTLQLQTTEDRLDFFQPGRGLMPASFKVVYEDDHEYLQADFGNHAIGRVTPVDSCLWWVYILRAYVKATGDFELAQHPDYQQGIRLILELCLVSRFDLYPTLLVPDGACMIDRRMGINGHPLEIQSLFFYTLRSGLELLLPSAENSDILKAVNARLFPLTKHIRDHYWIDLEKLNTIYRFKSEEYGLGALNQFNIFSKSIPYDMLSRWLPDDGGFFAGNLGPSLLDCRFFTLGNLVAVMAALSTESQGEMIIKLIERNWEDLVGQMPLKIVYPALEGQEWEMLTGCDPKNRAWSYHNGGNWPVLLWMFGAACLHFDRGDLVIKALDMAAKRMRKDKWIEYYDGRLGRLIGREARAFQTWTISGFLLTVDMLENPDIVDWLVFEPMDNIGA